MVSAGDGEQRIPRVQAVKLRDAIGQQLKRSIVEGRYPPGSRLLTEQQLARAMGASRTSVREAMRYLEAIGLVVSHQGAGVFVCRKGDPELSGSVESLLARQPTVEEVLEARLGIESRSSALAAQRRTAEELAVLEGLVERMADSLQDPGAHMRFDREFHRLIINAARNSIFENLIESVQEPLTNLLLLTVTLAGAMESSYRFHRRILQAIRKGDPRGAEAAMVGHLTDVAGQIQEVRQRVATAGVAAHE